MIKPGRSYVHDIRTTVFVIYCASKLHVFQWSSDAQLMTSTVYHKGCLQAAATQRDLPAVTLHFAPPCGGDSRSQRDTERCDSCQKTRGNNIQTCHTVSSILALSRSEGCEHHGSLCFMLIENRNNHIGWLTMAAVVGLYISADLIRHG